MSESKSTEKLIQPNRARYIKLGAGGMWEHECAAKGIIRFGFGTGTSERFELCRSEKWGRLSESFFDEEKNRGTATRFTNETRLFFEDDGNAVAAARWTWCVPRRRPS